MFFVISNYQTSESGHDNYPFDFAQPGTFCLIILKPQSSHSILKNK